MEVPTQKGWLWRVEIGSPTVSCRFLIMCRSSIPTNVSEAAANDLNPSMGRVTRLTAR
jgi:hypothetical protein